MASRLKNRQRAQIEALSAQKSEESQNLPDRGSASPKEDGDDFPAASNIAAKIAQRRLPRRTPTSHVKGVTGDLIRRRLSKTNEDQGSIKSKPKNCTFESSFEKSIDVSDPIPPEPSQPIPEKASSEPSAAGNSQLKRASPK